MWFNYRCVSLSDHFNRVFIEYWAELVCEQLRIINDYWREFHKLMVCVLNNINYLVIWFFLVKKKSNDEFSINIWSLVRHKNTQQHSFGMWGKEHIHEFWSTEFFNLAFKFMCTQFNQKWRERERAAPEQNSRLHKGQLICSTQSTLYDTQS